MRQLKAGDVVLCPVFSYTALLKPIGEDKSAFQLVEKNGRYFLKHGVNEVSSKDSYERLLLRFKFMCVGLSVATMGHFWVQDVLLDEQLEPLWERPKVLQLVVGEVGMDGPQPLTAFTHTSAQNVVGWIARSYSRVFIYYTVGLLLLRSPLPTEYLYADVLLNFFKVVEVITHRRTHKKPGLRAILADSRALGIVSADAADIRGFYIVRGRDSAHDYDNVEVISRQKAVECKMWVDELIVKDMVARAERPTIPYEFQEQGT
jgi:hypothetical protein